MPMPALPRVIRPFALVFLTACGGGGGGTTEPAAAVITATATSGGSQSKTANAASDPMTATFTKDGAALANASVTWSTTGGTLASATTTTNAQGQATNSLTTVGGTAGSVTVTASSNGRSATFGITVNALAAGPPASISYAARIVGLDSAGSATAVPVVRDANGQALSGQTITYTSRTATVATVSAAGQISGLKSGQTFIVASVTNASNVTFRDSVVALVGVPDGPIVFADMARFDLKGDTTFTVAVVADMRASTTKLGSGKVTVTWNTAMLTYQSHAEGASTVGATVNAGSAATGTLTLAFANSTGFGGKVELRKLTFKAATAAATSGTLTATANEAYAAGSYANLLAKTVSVALSLVTR